MRASILLTAVYYIIRSNERCSSIMTLFETALKSHLSLSSEWQMTRHCCQTPLVLTCRNENVSSQFKRGMEDDIWELSWMEIMWNFNLFLTKLLYGFHKTWISHTSHVNYFYGTSMVLSYGGWHMTVTINCCWNRSIQKLLLLETYLQTPALVQLTWVLKSTTGSI